MEKELANHQPARGCSPPIPVSLWEVTRAENSLVHTGMSWVGTRDGEVSLGVQQPTGKGERSPDSCAYQTSAQSLGMPPA